MDIRQQVIALVHGDIRETTQATELLRRLAESPEDVSLLLDQIALYRSMPGLRNRVVSPADETRELLRKRINQFEQDYGPAAAVGTHAGTTSVPERVLPRTGQIVSVLLLMSLSLLVGIWIGSGEEKNGETESGATSSSSPALTDTDPNDDHVMTKPVSPHSSLQGVPESRNKIPKPVSVLSNRSATTRKGRNPEEPITDPEHSGLSSLLLSPRGGESYRRGEILPIRWRGIDEARVLVQLSADGGNSWRNIGTTTDARGMDWAIPEEMPTGSHYRIRLRPLSPETNFRNAERVLPLTDEGISVDMSQDGTMLVTAGREKEVVLWDIDAGRRIRTMTGHTAPVQSVRFSPDGSRIISSAIDSSAVIWDVASGEAEHVLRGLPDREDRQELVWWADFSPDGRLAATGHDDGTVIIWDAATGTERSRLHPHSEAIRFLAFAGNGDKILATGSDRFGSVTDLATGITQRFEHRSVRKMTEETESAATMDDYREALRRNLVHGIILTTDGSTVLTCGYDGFVRFWNVRTGELIREKDYNNGTEIAMLEMSRDGSLVAAIGSNGESLILDPFSGEVFGRMTINTPDTVIPMIHAAFGSDGTRLAVSHMNGSVSLWNVAEKSDPFGGEEWKIE